MPGVEYMNTNIFYIKNDLNQLYGGKFVPDPNKRNFWVQHTGWHFIPNTRFDNWLTPRQYYDLMNNHSKFRVHRVELILQNMIPLTDNLAINQETTFMSFNNTIYALGYTDKHYETIQIDEKVDLLWREGVRYKQASYSAAPIISGKQYLPLYAHPLPMEKVPDSTGTLRETPLAIYSWDPLVHSSSLMELRPGKNAITFSWSRHPEDDSKWFSTIQNYWVTNAEDRSQKPIYTYADYDFRRRWITPGGLFKVDPRNGIFENKRTMVTQDQIWKYPMTNFFVKMMPIVGTKNQLLQHEAQVVLTRKIYFDVQPRIGAINFPQLDAYYIDKRKVVGALPDASVMLPSMQPAYAPTENIGRPPYGAFDTVQAPWKETMDNFLDKFQDTEFQSDIPITKQTLDQIQRGTRTILPVTIHMKEAKQRSTKTTPAKTTTPQSVDVEQME